MTISDVIPIVGRVLTILHSDHSSELKNSLPFQAIATALDKQIKGRRNNRTCPRRCCSIMLKLFNATSRTNYRVIMGRFSRKFFVQGAFCCVNTMPYDKWESTSHDLLCPSEHCSLVLLPFLYWNLFTTITANIGDACRSCWECTW